MSVTRMKFRRHVAPAQYVCGECRASRVKLWRPLNSLRLHCVDHAAKKASLDPKHVTASGEYKDLTTSSELSWLGPKQSTANWLGNMLPAIPDLVHPDGDIMCYYPPKRLPRPGMRWWIDLPLRR